MHPHKLELEKPAFREGYAAREERERPYDNPYDGFERHDDYAAWRDGWRTRDDELRHRKVWRPFG